MWIGGFDLKSKSKSTKGRRNEDTELIALSTGFIGTFRLYDYSLSFRILSISEYYKVILGTEYLSIVYVE